MLLGVVVLDQFLIKSYSIKCAAFECFLKARDGTFSLKKLQISFHVFYLIMFKLLFNESPTSTGWFTGVLENLIFFSE